MIRPRSQLNYVITDFETEYCSDNGVAISLDEMYRVIKLKEREKFDPLKESLLTKLKKKGFIPDSSWEFGIDNSVAWVGLYATHKDKLAENYKNQDHGFRTKSGLDESQWFEIYEYEL